MESVEIQEMPGKEGRGRPQKMIVLEVELGFADATIMSNLQLKRMKQTGEDVTRGRIISEALQSLAKEMSDGKAEARG